MASGRSNQLTKQMGEYLVACELARRGLLVATFSGNVPNYDIIATDLKGASCPIQVKTSRGGSWQFTITKFVDVSFEGGRQVFGDRKPLEIPDLICVLVIASEKYGADQFFVLEWSKLVNIIVTHHRSWLELHGGVRPNKPDSMHCALFKHQVMEYKDNWSLITDRLQFTTSGEEV